MAARDPSQTLVAITGASGYISAHIISQLLAKGYKIRAIVRDLSDPNKVTHLKALPQKEGQLTFTSADITAGAYGDVLKGADILIHTATPYRYTAPDPQKEIVEPAVKGTVDAINAAIANGVKRVVVTSSGGAFLRFPVTESHVYTESDWNTVSSVTNNPYFYSKKLAEEAAWNLWKENKDKFDLVVVNPLFVVGPTLSPSLNASLTRTKSYLLNDGVLPILPGRAGFCDVRDVATAHVIAAEHPQAVGRRLFVSAEVNSWVHMATSLKKAFPKYPGINVEGVSEGVNFEIDTSVLKSLGFKSFIPLEQSFRDTVESMEKVGLLTPPV